MAFTNSRFSGAITLLITIFALSLPAYAKYSGGTGEPNDPYQIATAEDLIKLGESTDDYGKHIILTANIDLDPNLPGRKVFDKAVIAPYTDPNTERAGFVGFFDGNGHAISNLTITGDSFLGLFGILYHRVEIKDLGLVDVNITGSGEYVGGLVGWNNFSCSITRCYSTGTIKGTSYNVGGLVGYNAGSITDSHSTGIVRGDYNVGGLVGRNTISHLDVSINTSHSTAIVRGDHSVGGLVGQLYGSDITLSYSTGPVSGVENIGGLVGLCSYGDITKCNSTGMVTGDKNVGGLVGSNYYFDSISKSYSTGAVSGDYTVGGLVGNNSGDLTNCYSTGNVTDIGVVSGDYGDYTIGGLVGNNFGDLTNCYSTGAVSGNGPVGGLVGLEARVIYHAINCFWDIESSGQTNSDGGTGSTTAEMQTVSTFLEAGWDFVNETTNGTEDIWLIDEGQDYPRLCWEKYGGGTGESSKPYLIYTAEHLNAIGAEPNDWDKHFKLMEDIDLSGYSYDKAVIAPHIGNQDLFKGIPFTGVFNGNCHIISNLTIEGGGLVSLFGLLESGAEVRDLGILDVNIIGSGIEVGGLVANNQGYVANCYSTGTVSGDWSVGGLIGNNSGSINNCYSNSTVIGNNIVGGLVGMNEGVIIHCYSNNTVNGVWLVGGLVGYGLEMDVSSCFWNVEISGLTTSTGGTGKTTAEMQTAGTFLEAGWDFVDETANGIEDFWWIDEGNDYPRLWWELGAESSP